MRHFGPPRALDIEDLEKGLDLSVYIGWKENKALILEGNQTMCQQNSEGACQWPTKLCFLLPVFL